jgi:hypothetical protein
MGADKKLGQIKIFNLYLWPFCVSPGGFAEVCQ